MWHSWSIIAIKFYFLCELMNFIRQRINCRSCVFHLLKISVKNIDPLYLYKKIDTRSQWKFSWGETLLIAILFYAEALQFHLLKWLRILNKCLVFSILLCYGLASIWRLENKSRVGCSMRISLHGIVSLDLLRLKIVWKNRKKKNHFFIPIYAEKGIFSVFALITEQFL